MLTDLQNCSQNDAKVLLEAGTSLVLILLRSLLAKEHAGNINTIHFILTIFWR